MKTVFEKIVGVMPVKRRQEKPFLADAWDRRGPGRLRLPTPRGFRASPRRADHIRLSRRTPSSPAGPAALFLILSPSSPGRGTWRRGGVV